MTGTTVTGSAERTARVPEICAGIAGGIALLALAGWLSGARFLAGGWATYVPMAPSTALVFLLLSGALFCFARWPNLRPSRLFLLIATGVAFVMGMLVLAEFITGVDLGIEHLLSRTNEFLGSTPLGRMSPLTAFAFLLESAALLLLTAERWRNSLTIGALLAAGATAISAVVLIGYAYGAPLLYGGTFIPVALPTAIGFVLVGVGQLYLSAPGIPALRDWDNTTMRGILLRAFLPFMLFFVLLDGWVDLKFESVLSLNPALWNSLKSLAAGILIVIIAGWIARRSGRELERAQKTLEESEEKFRSVFENSPLGKSLTGIDKSLRVNKAFCEILGYTEQELNTKNWKEFTHPDDIQKSLDANRALLEGRISRAHFEKRYIHKNGRIVWTDLTTAIQRDASGQPLYFITTISDITERKRADEAQREREEKWRQLFAILPVGVSVLDPGRAITETNPALERILGMTAEGVRARAYEERKYIRSDGTPMPPQDFPSVRAVQEQRTIEHTEIGVVTEEGRVIWTDVSAAPLPHTSGGCVVVTSDLMERKHAEDSSRESEQRYRSLFENMLNGFAYCQMISDGESAPDFIYLDVNNAFESLTGLKDVVGRKVSEVIPGIRESDPQLLETYGRVALTGKPETLEVYVEALEMWFSISVYSPQKGCFVAVFDVITDRKLAEANIHQLNAELEQRVARRTSQLEAANKELESFAYSVSHDLRAPLRAVSGFTNILIEDYGPSLDAEGQRVCGVIIKEAQRMGQLIDDLLSFSRLGRTTMRRVKIDMCALVEAVVNELTTPERRSQLNLTIDELPQAVGDPVLIRQVWVNLISNALKFTSGRERPAIEVGSSQSQDETVYSVRDNGAGFDMRYADKLFGVFQRLHSESEFEGTGVGLAIVQRVISRHDGRVWGEGRLDEGAVFYFALPRNEISDD